METAALDAAHIDVALVHKGFHEERECFVIGPDRGIGADMRPERLDQLECSAHIGDNIRAERRNVHVLTCAMSC